MAKFCSWCGEALEPGSRFCPECGARVLESVKIDGSADAVDPMRGFDIVGGEALPADKTIRIDRDPADTDTLVLPTDNAQKRFALEETPRKSRPALIVCIVAIAVLAIIVGVLAWTQAREEQSAPTDSPSTQKESVQEREDEARVDATEQDAPSISDAPSDSAATMTEDEIFAYLDEAYGRLAAYDDRVGACVEDFNGLFLARSMDDRQAAKDEADALLSDLEDELASLEDMRIPASSPYADDAAAVIELYGCQKGRVQSLTDAWALDVTFEVPSEHKDAILEVLAASNEGGTNKYLTRYDELYPSAKPQRR